MAEEKPPPHNIEAERAVLGAVLLDNRTFVHAAEIVREGDFYREAHRHIWRSLRTLDERRAPADLVTLVAELRGSEKLEACGGASYVASLIDSVPAHSPVREWGRIVRSLGLRRDLIVECQRVACTALDESAPIEVTIDAHQRATLKLLEGNETNHDLTQKQVMREACDRIERMATGITGIPSGIEWLDDRTGGFEPGSLIVIGGRTKSGKSALCAQLVTVMAAGGHKVRMYSLEMSPQAIGTRMLFAEARVDRYHMRHGNDTGWAKISMALSKLNDLPITYDRRASPTSQEISISAHRQASVEGKLDVVCVDHLQRIRLPGRPDRMREGVSINARDMKTLARSLDCVVLLACQLNRDAEGREPSLSELKETGTIEEEADIVLALHPDPHDRMTESINATTHLLILKNREGYEGRTTLTFERPFTRFSELGENV